MRPRHWLHPPLTPPFLISLLALLVVAVVLIQMGIFTYAFEKLGLTERQIFWILLLSILGSFVNIPLKTYTVAETHPGQIVRVWGIPYVIPDFRLVKRTVLAVNLGGGVIPVLLSLYLLARLPSLLHPLLGIAFMAFFTHRLARVVQGAGVLMPAFIPPILAALVALLLLPENAPALAYVSGSLGTLIGADVMNLPKIRRLGAQVVSIGGAGTFDGIFLTGVIAVLLA